MLTEVRSCDIDFYFVRILTKIVRSGIFYSGGVTMSITITATEFKKNLGHYFDLSQTKEEVYITKNGSKIARLAPIYTDAEEYFIVKEDAEFYGNLTVSYDEFMEMAEHSEHRLEYLNGDVYQMASPSVSHQKSVGNIHFLFRLALQNINVMYLITV